MNRLILFTCLTILSTLTFGQIVISEIHYNPAGTGTDVAEEFIEIVNLSSTTSIDITGYTIADNSAGYTFPSTTMLGPGVALAVARTPATYPGSVGPATIGLSNSGETVTLTDASSAVVDVVIYDDADGGDDDGNSLQVVDGTLPNGVTSSNWTAATPTPGVYSGPLPVTLTAFDAKPTTSGAILEWTTASEENNDYFAVEISRNAASFSESAQIQGNGTTESLATYAYEYHNLPAGTHYFRLRQVDFDGQSSYSDVVSLTIKGKRDFLMVRNLAQDFAQVDVTTPRQARMLDMTGAVVAEFLLQAGRNNIDISGLANGMYVVSDGTNAKRFVK